MNPLNPLLSRLPRPACAKGQCQQMDTSTPTPCPQSAPQWKSDSMQQTDRTSAPCTPTIPRLRAAMRPGLEKEIPSSLSDLLDAID
jgi:hypothetical protein